MIRPGYAFALFVIIAAPALVPASRVLLGLLARLELALRRRKETP